MTPRSPSPCLQSPHHRGVASTAEGALSVRLVVRYLQSPHHRGVVSTLPGRVLRPGPRSRRVPSVPHHRGVASTSRADRSRSSCAFSPLIIGESPQQRLTSTELTEVTFSPLVIGESPQLPNGVVWNALDLQSPHHRGSRLNAGQIHRLGWVDLQSPHHRGVASTAPFTSQGVARVWGAGLKKVPDPDTPSGQLSGPSRL
jgi:hypothetical protein